MFGAHPSIYRASGHWRLPVFNFHEKKVMKLKGQPNIDLSSKVKKHTQQENNKRLLLSTRCC